MRRSDTTDRVATSSSPLAALVVAAAGLLTACGARAVSPFGVSDASGDAGVLEGGGCRGGDQVCNGACADLTINPFNCGACGNRCPTGGVCIAGTCRDDCRPPRAMCGDTCLSVESDPANCGGCGRRCDVGATCQSRHCRSPNDPTYTVARVTPATWIDACSAPGAMVLFPTVDDVSQLALMPFAFRYWGTTRGPNSAVNVSTNGWLGLDGMTGNSLGGMLPSMSAPFAVVAPHWGDLYTRATGVCISTVGAEPSRQFVVEWNDARYCCGDQPDVHLTFEAVFHEGSGLIDLVYRDMTGARQLPAGIEDLEGVTAVTVCDAPMCEIHAGDQFRFTPVN